MVEQKLYSLDVAQGMATFFESYNSDNQIEANALFDFGAKSQRTRLPADNAIKFLAQQIVKRNPPNGHLDTIIISHKDSDHVNYIPKLLAKLPNMTISFIRYSGNPDWYNKSIERKTVNILQLLYDRTEKLENSLGGFTSGFTSWSETDGQFNTPVILGTNYKIYMMCANSPDEIDNVGTEPTDFNRKPSGDEANARSLLAALLCTGGRMAIISGDATNVSFIYFNMMCSKTFDNTAMLLLPHHGSRRTTLGLNNPSSLNSFNARQNAIDFAKKMNSKTLVSSAENTNHHHPSQEIISIFLPYTDTDGSWWIDPALRGNHLVTAYYDIQMTEDIGPINDYISYLTPWNIYSTRYSFNLIFRDKGVYYMLDRPISPVDPDLFKDYNPPEATNWLYSYYSDTGVDLERLPTLPLDDMEMEAGDAPPPDTRALAPAASPAILVRRRTEPGRPRAPHPPARQRAASRL